jgi:hypothetical protein
MVSLETLLTPNSYALHEISWAGKFTQTYTSIVVVALIPLELLYCTQEDVPGLDTLLVLNRCYILKVMHTAGYLLSSWFASQLANIPTSTASPTSFSKPCHEKPSRAGSL